MIRMNRQSRAVFAVSASVFALAAGQPASAQALCGDGSTGPVCTINNTGSRGAITGTVGTATIVTNSGTITGQPAISQGQSSVLTVTNSASGTITGTGGGTAITGQPQLAFIIDNAGTINGNVVFSDPPAPNIFTGTNIAYISNGGVLNGDLQLGTTGYSTSVFIQRGADDGVTGSIMAGLGLDAYIWSQSQNASITLGQKVLPATFEIAGYEALGTTTLTLNGSGTTTILAGTGTVINNATIGVVDASSSYPPGAQVFPGAIGYYQPNRAVFRRDQIPLGQPGSFFVQPFGSALTSFTNNGVLNGDINLAAGTFVNTGHINLNSNSNGTTIYGAANTDFLFRNTGSIAMADNGARPAFAQLISEFEGGLNAAVRIRSALDTTVAKDVRIENSGSVIGGLNAIVAAKTFAFENSGQISGLFERGLTLQVGELELVAGADAQDEFNGDTAAIRNTATGTIADGFLADLSVKAATFENQGAISAGSEEGVALYVDHSLLEDANGNSDDATSFSFVNGGQIAGTAGFELEAGTATFTNSGSIIRSLQPLTGNPYFSEHWAAVDIESETQGNQSLTFTNSGTIRNLDRAGTGLDVEVEAGDEDSPALRSGSAHIVNSGTIEAKGGAVVVPGMFVPGFDPSTFFAQPYAGLSVDATDVTDASTVTIDNLAGGTISASGHVYVFNGSQYLDQGAGSEGAFGVALAATGKQIMITNAGLISGGAGTTIGADARFDAYLPDNYLAGAIQTAGDSPDVGAGEVYVGSIDHVVNTATGQIVGSVDLGANDDVIENYGSIAGDVFLRDGNDTFIQSLTGTFNGIADGGAGTDTLVFDITGTTYTGVIDPALRAKFINFDIEKIAGTGAIVSNQQQAVADNVPLVLAAGSSLDVGAGNTALLGGTGDSNVTVTSTVTITGNVDLQSGNNTFDNQGTLNGNIIAGDGANNLANSGTVNGNVTLGDGGNTLTNSGAISGDVTLGGGDDTLILRDNWAIGGTVDGGAGTDAVQITFANPVQTASVNTSNNGALPVLDLSGFQQIEALDVNGGTGKIGGTATFDQINVNDGRLIGDHGSTLNADVTVGSGATFGSAGAVNGDVAVGSGGMLSPGASVAKMTINGDLSLAGGTATIFEFEGTEADQIEINNGSLTIANGAVIRLTGTLTPGTTKELIVVNNGNISGTFTEDPDHPGVVGVLRYFDTNGDLLNDRLQLMGIFVTATGASPQVQATVNYVNDLLVSGGASSALIAAVPALMDGGGSASAAAFGQLNAEAYASAAQLGVENGLILAKAGRSSALRTDSDHVGPFTFAQGLGDWRTFKGDAASGVSRATTRSYGVLGGIGYGSTAASIGAFVGYLDGRQTIAGLDARTDTDGVIAGLTAHATSGALEISVTAAHDWSNAATRRTVPGGSVSSRYDLDSFVMDASLTYSASLGNGWTILPAIGVTHVSARRHGAVESGNAAFALNVAQKTTNATFLDGSLGISGEIGKIEPWAQAGLRHQLGGATPSATAAFQGANSSLTVLGAARKETVATIEAGLAAAITEKLRLHVSYQGEFGGGQGNAANVGLRLAF